MSNLVFCLMGPTASGKTALACEWVRELPCEIISVDSAMIYRGMNIGTAKPDLHVLQQAPHHLIDICTPDQHYSVAAFCEEAWAMCEAVRGRGHIPLFVGGTMMYFRALQQGLSPLPPADVSIRAELMLKHKTHGAGFMYAWLQRVDPESALRLHPNDTQRIQRALEVHQITGMPLSVFLAQKSMQSQVRFMNIGLFPTRRAWLHARIACRFEAMLSAGLIEETSSLISQWALTAAHSSMRCVGYRQVFDYLHGQIDYAALSEKGTAATRQLAKRQLTWLRSWPNMQLYDAENPACSSAILSYARKIIDNG